MNEKIKGHQLERGAYVYVRNRHPIRCAIIWRVRNGSMPWLSVHPSWAFTRSP